jgi:hypothetical protein
MSDLIVNPFNDIVPPVTTDNVDLKNDYNQWSMGGGGANGLKADSQGLWFGSRKFADAPFSVDMLGNVKANSIVLGGYIATGGAAADINANVTTISGGKITTNTINANAMVVGSMRQVFTATPTTPYAIGDLWSAGSSGDLKRCIVTRATGAYNAADWDLASKYTDDSNTTTIIGNTVTTGFVNALNITALGTVTAGTLQGLTIQTAASGARVTMTGSNNYISIYDASRERIRISGNSIYFYNESGTYTGGLYSLSDDYMTLYAPTNLRIRNNHTSYYIMFDIATENIGYFHTNGFTITSGNTINAPEVSATYLTSVNTLRFASTSTPLTDNGSIYYNGSHFYGRLGGSWYQLD